MLKLLCEHPLYEYLKKTHVKIEYHIRGRSCLWNDSVFCAQQVIAWRETICCIVHKQDLLPHESQGGQQVFSWKEDLAHTDHKSKEES